jgi:hypothetical protein
VDPVPIVVDLGAVVSPDLGHVDALARLHLAAKRLGLELCIANARDDFVALLELVGLSLEPVGQSERGKRLGIQEVVQPRDPPT